MFNKNERSSFKYWFAHWCAFQMTALNLKCWKFKYLLHDIEKPWLKLLYKDYLKVQKYHRKHSKHHVEYYVNLYLNNKNTKEQFDWDAMIIDFECSHFTKESAQLLAKDTVQVEYNNLIELNYGVTENITYFTPTGEFETMPYNYCAELFLETATEHLKQLGLI